MSKTRTRSRASRRLPHGKPAPFTPFASQILQMLAVGYSVTSMLDELGINRDRYYQWRKRFPDFERATNAARQRHRAETLDSLMDDAAYARALVAQLMHDENVPAPLRLRAALAFLNGRAFSFLPPPLEDDPGVPISPLLPQLGLESQPDPDEMPPAAPPAKAAPEPAPQASPTGESVYNREHAEQEMQTPAAQVLTPRKADPPPNSNSRDSAYKAKSLAAPRKPPGKTTNRAIAAAG